jgi:hypothetical protein
LKAPPFCQYIHSPKLLYAIILAKHLSRGRSVEALLRLILLERLQTGGSAIAVATRVGVTEKPDTEATSRSVRAGLEADITSLAWSSKDQASLVVKLEGTTLLVLANALHSGSVSENALAHTAAVDVHAERWIKGVQVEATCWVKRLTGRLTY